ncbi:MerR family DNA-binding transcriptional regulator [Rhodococcus opacus]|uniref:HTH merR-type domain-containing protein n=1 Tax=Rhodococcus opacus TaxID=37919 RepID=A0A076EZ66_RHOOP|nr:MerR family DNA-binding transcriptional regulator [Rhodococcus opacus]AII10537.1 hypothetical protein EP51_40485 [Rhodococcus opacus]
MSARSTPRDYTTREAAAPTGLPARTLRYYESAGVIAPISRYMSAASLAQAIWGAIQHAERDEANLVGDENLTFREYFQMLVDAAGGLRGIDERDEEHPFCLTR